MITGWIIYPRYVAAHPDNAFGWMAEEASSAGIGLKVLFFEDLALGYGDGKYDLFLNGEKVGDYPDFVITRGYEWAVSRHFELMGIPVINSTASMALCKDKLLAHQMFVKAGIPTPLTIQTPGIYDYDHLSAAFGSGRFIVKRRDGAKGEDVFLVEDQWQLAEAVAECSGNVICQRFVEESRGRDIRVWTIGGKAVAAVMRHSESSFKSNFSLGGHVAPFELTREAAELAEAASMLVGAEFAGVDLLFGREGLIVNEINGNAGFRTLSRVGENNIPGRLFEYIKKKYTA